jgi:hypothetical protein
MQQAAGRLLYLCLALLLASCRNSTPPAISICIGDGFGGADCQLEPTSPLAQCCIQNPQGYYCPPTCLKNAWITSEAEEASFSSWCYDAPVPAVQAQMDKLKSRIK